MAVEVDVEHSLKRTFSKPLEEEAVAEEGPRFQYFYGVCDRHPLRPSHPNRRTPREVVGKKNHHVPAAAVAAFVSVAGAGRLHRLFAVLRIPVAFFGTPRRPSFVARTAVVVVVDGAGFADGVSCQQRQMAGRVEVGRMPVDC